MSKFQRFMKTKKGFTLVELMIVVALLAILVAVALPIYGYVQKQGRIDVCKITRDSARHDLIVWAMQHPFNDNLSFTIESDGSTGQLSATGNSKITADYLKNKAFKNTIPHCPCESGTYTVTLTKSTTKNFCKVTVTCDGGTDGDCHK